MRLINTTTLELREFIGQGIPPYAILSHTWGGEEVTFQDWQGALQGSLVKAGLAKIRGACAQALEDGLEYLWVDTNCIDKTSSAELSEAINSMFAWYRGSRVCYAYLVDVPDAVRLHENGGAFSRSRWFTRGWTLQELLAPMDVVFFAADWKRLGTRPELKVPLVRITGVPAEYLTGAKPIWMASIARRMSWMSKRVTTRTEDMAYSMLGIFDIHMPLIYGEGPRAFLRLQEEILKSTDDQSILCWEWDRCYVDDSWASVLAPCPAVFLHAGHYIPTAWDDKAEAVPYGISNVGVSIRLPLVPTANPSMFLAVLDVRPEWMLGDWDADLPYTHQLCIPLQRGRIYRRLPFPNRPFLLHMAMVVQESSIHVMAREISPGVQRGYISTRQEQSALFGLPAFRVGLLVVFGAQVPRVEVVYSSYSCDLLETRGIMTFSFPATRQESICAAAVLRLRFKDGHESFILLAAQVNEGTDKHPTPRIYCQVVPMDRDSGNATSQLVADVSSPSFQINQDVDFSSDGAVTVALGGAITNSYGGREVVRVVHVVYKDRDRCELLWESAEFPSSLVPGIEQTSASYSRSE